MADADKTLKVNIDLATSGQEQAGQVKAAIKAVADESERYQKVLEQMAARDASSAQDKRWAELNAQAKAYVPIAQAAADAERVRAEASAKLEEQLRSMGDAQKESGDKSGEHEQHLHSLRGLFTELNKIVPELGHSLHFAFAGPVGAVALLAGAVAEAYGILKEFNAQLDETAKVASESPFLSNLIEQARALADAAGEAQGFADSLHNIVTAHDNLNTKLKDQLALYQAIERARAAQTSAEKGLDIAKIQEAEAARRLTPEKAAEARAAVEKKYTQQAQTEHEAGQDAELASKKNTLEQAAKKQAELAEAARRAQEQVDADTYHSAHVKLDPEAQLQKIRKAQQQFNEFGEVEKKLAKGEATALEAGKHQYMLEGGGLDALKTYISKLEVELAQYNKDQANAGPKRAHTDDAAEAKRKLDENTRIITDLTHEIAELNKNIGATRPIERGTVNTKNATIDQQENTRIIQDFERDARVLQQYAKSRTPSAELIANTQKAMADIILILHNHGSIVANVPDHAAAIANLKRDSESIKAQMANQRNNAGR